MQIFFRCQLRNGKGRFGEAAKNKVIKRIGTIRATCLFAAFGVFFFNDIHRAVFYFQVGFGQVLA